MTGDEEKYLTTKDVAKRLRRHPRTVRDWIVKGCPTQRGTVRLEATKAGKGWLVHPDWLALFEHRIRSVRRADLDLE
ncbi:MAG: helix-turn-helix domain-containing protein [Parvularcula sp.]|jgi:hypothetical protein|nr:helix-turn-helix domain-containing protein [Parvularcula sp.]